MPNFRNPEKGAVTLEISRLKVSEDNKFLFKQQFRAGQSLRTFRLLGEFVRFANPKKEPAPEGLKRVESAHYGHPGFYKDKKAVTLGQKPVVNEIFVQLLNEDMHDVMGDMVENKHCMLALQGMYSEKYAVLVDEMLEIMTKHKN
ncbi:MAG: hypothetical protein WC861_04825 [Candidatus Micrarchaeia archaeon]|jgi:hypothetical protein